jgi:hypothetical protein
MTFLPISNPRPAPRETVYSYLSRLASTWDTQVADLAYDMGAPFKRFLEQDPEAFDALGEWADLDPHDLEEMLSWTGVRAGNVRMSFRGEVFISRALRNPVMRGCPVCLREDAGSAAGSGSAAMVMRGDWQMREAITCIRHGHPVVPLWKADQPRDRYDIQARLREIEGDILSGDLDQPTTPPSAYDLWLDGRLEDGRDETWFKGQPLFAATTFCRLLGQAVLRGEEREDGQSRDGVHAAGFDVARHGEAVLREALDRIAASATGHLDEPNKAFGPLYPGLNRDYAGEKGFARYTAILRACILDHWPIAAGETVLGEVVPERHLHSLVTASREIGVGVGVIEQFLIEAGALPEQDDRPPSRRLFDPRAHADLLAEIPTLVGAIALRKAMGATKHELEALEADGVLVPRTRLAKIKSPWRLSNGPTLVAELENRAVPVAAEDGTWETLLLARKRTTVSLAIMMTAIREGYLPVGQRAGVAGFHGIVAPKKLVERLVPTLDVEGEGVEPNLLDLIPAAEFGRSIGLRDNGNFLALIEAGHVPARQVLNLKTGRLQYHLGTEDIAAFHRRFATLTTLSTETGHHRNTLRGLLAAARVSRFAPEGQDFGPVYLRAEASQAVR